MRSAKQLKATVTGSLEDALSDDAVLEFLETDISGDDDRRRIRGIGNGLALGALIWAAVIGGLFIVA